MELDLKSGYVNIADIKFPFSELNAVEKVSFTFHTINMEFLYVDDGDYFFFYADAARYAKLLQLIAEQPTAVSAQLKNTKIVMA